MKHHRYWSPRRVIAGVSAIVALIVFAGASITVCWALFARQIPAYDLATQQFEVAGYAVKVALPTAMVVFWILGTIALIAMRQARMLNPFLFTCILVVVVDVIVPLTGPFPVRGLAAMLIVLLFVSLNLAAVYAAWRYILRVPNV